MVLAETVIVLAEMVGRNGLAEMTCIHFEHYFRYFFFHIPKLIGFKHNLRLRSRHLQDQDLQNDIFRKKLSQKTTKKACFCSKLPRLTVAIF